MDTVLAWLTFGLVVWLLLAIQTRGKELGKGRVPGPIWCIHALYEASHEAREGGAAGTDSDEPEADTRTDTGQEGPRRVDKSQDTPPDIGQDTPRIRLRDKLTQAADLLRREPEGAEEPVSTPHVQPAPLATSQPVTGGRRVPSDHRAPAPAAEPVPREIVIYVPPGDSRMGTIRAVDADDHPVIVRYLQHAGPSRVPTQPLTEAEDDPDDADDRTPLNEITLRRDWLRTLDADNRFTTSEIAAMYRTKWGRGEKTLRRDRDANNTLANR